VGGRTKTHPGIQGSGRRGLHESSARDQAHAAAALSQGCVEAMKGAQPHQSGTLKRGPWPNRGLAPGRRLRMPNPDVLSSEAPRITRLPLATFFRPSSQGPDSKRLCPICTTTTRPLAIGASTQLTRTKEAHLSATESPCKRHLRIVTKVSVVACSKLSQPAVYQGPGLIRKSFRGAGPPHLGMQV
jgi:hypothetical protein